jgi:tRNA(Ile)-lysidine synthase
MNFPAAVGQAMGRLLGDQRGPGVVAVSGGADSVALLRTLANSPQSAGLTIAHLNHRLRGADSDADAAFVAALCPGLPHFLDAIDVSAAADKAGDNLEAIARQIRYDFLVRVARQTGASWVATAHTRDDQAETVLHRLIRGSGLRGLRGIAERRELAPGVRLVRPLLTLSREDVIAYLRAIGQPWREDATNRDTRFTRNRIRHELLPLLRTFNPAIEEVLSRTAAQAKEVFERIEEDVALLLDTALLPPAGKIVILDAPRIIGQPDFLVREILNRIWEIEGWSRSGMTHEHWQRVADVARGGSPAWDLPDGIRVVGTPRVIRIGPATEFPS